ncbi:NAD(P)-dependent oxidoreductase, partial [bacterium]
MAHSFDANGTGALAQLNSIRRRVAITGAAGNIGSYFAQKLHDKYELVLIDRDSDQLESISFYGQTVLAELSELDKLTEACRGADTLIHLAGNPSPNQTWSSVLDNN